MTGRDPLDALIDADLQAQQRAAGVPAELQTPPIAAPAASAPDPLDALIDRDLQQRSVLRQAAGNAVRRRPDEAAQDAEMARLLRIDPEMVERNRAEIRQQIEARRIADIAERSPALAASIAKNPTLAATGQDEMQELSFLERQIAAAKSGFAGQRGSNQFTGAAVGYRNVAELDDLERRIAAGEPMVTARERVYAGMTPEQRAAAREQVTRQADLMIIRSAAYNRESQDEARKYHPAVTRAMQAETFGEVWDAFIEAPLEFIATIGVQSAAQNPLQTGSAAVAGPAALAGRAAIASAAGLVGTAGGGIAGAAMEFGGALMESLAEKGVNTADPETLRQAVANRELMDEVRSAAAIKAGVITAFDQIGVASSMRVFAPTRVTGSNVTRKVAQEATNLGAQTVVEGALGAAGEATGSVASGGDVSAGAVFSEFMGGFGQAGVNVAMTSGMRVYEEHRAASGTAEQVRSLMDAAAALKTRERDPESFRQFVEEASAGGAEYVYVDGAVLTEVLNQDGAGADVLRAIPGMQEQITEAALGTDVEIPVADLLTRVSGTPLAEALLPHIRASVDMPSLAEAEARMQAQVAETERRMQEQAEGRATPDERETWARAQKAVADSIAADMRAAGRPAAEARLGAMMAANVFGVIAGKTGVTPEVAYEHYGLDVIGGAAQSPEVRWNALARALTLAEANGETADVAILRARMDRIRPTVESARRRDEEAQAAARARADAQRALSEGVRARQDAERQESVAARDQAAAERATAGQLAALEREGERAAADATAAEGQAAAEFARDRRAEARAEGQRATAIEPDLQATIQDELQAEMAGRVTADPTLLYQPSYEPVPEGGALSQPATGPSPAQPSALDRLAPPLQRQASTFDEARAQAKAFQGKPLTNAATGMVVQVSRNSLDKMLSTKAVGKSASPRAQSLAVANADELFRRAIPGWSKPDEKGDPNIAAIHRFFAPMQSPDGVHLVKLTVKEVSQADRSNVLYTIEAVELAGEPPAASWVGEIANADGIDPRTIRSAGDVLTLAQQIEAVNSGRDPFVGSGTDPTSATPATPPPGQPAPPSGDLQESGRGNISFGRGIGIDGATIRLLATADASTFIHELGHFYLEVVTDIARRPDAPADLRADLDTVLDWAGWDRAQDWSTATIDERRDVHERFARGFEAYLFEGKAPTPQLRGAFARFRAWLVGVYADMTRLNVELTPEVRGVFDRMVATSEQLQDAATARSQAPLFRSAAEADMEPEAWNAYIAQGEDGTRTAIEILQARQLRDMQWITRARKGLLGKLRREAMEKVRAIEAEVTAEVQARPEFMAKAFLDTGKVPDVPQAVDILARLAVTGVDVGSPAAARQAPVHVVAEAFGFSSADEMARAVKAAGDMKTVIRGETNARALERHGDITSPEALENAVNEALQNEAHIRMVATEIAAMQDLESVREQTGTTTIRRGKHKGQERAVTVNAIVAAARRYAAEIIGRTRIRDLKPGRYTVSANRAAAKAARLWAGGDRTGAAAAKRDQILNARAAREAAEAKTETDRIVRRLRRMADSPPDSIDVGYREQILALLERFDLHRMTQRDLRRRESLADWIAGQEADGITPLIPQSLRDEANRRPYQDLTVQELRDLDDAVKQIAHIGRVKMKLLTAKGDRELAAAAREMADTIREHGGPKRERRYEPERGIIKGIRGFMADHRKFASLVRQMDGGRDNGPLWQMLVRTVNAAADREASMREAATIALSAILDPVQRQAGGLREKVFISGIGASLTREARIAVALNMGNSGNRQRLVDGHGWSEAQIAAVARTLTSAEWDAVQKTWDHIDSYWPQVVEKTRRLQGLTPEKIEAESFEVVTAEGTVKRMRGGYYPAQYDTDLSDKAASHEDAEHASQMMKGAFTAASTRRGFLEARAEKNVQPIKLSLDPLFRHVGDVIHDLSFHEWLIDANRLLRHSDVSGAIRDHYGTEALRTLRDAVRDIAAGEGAATQWAERALLVMRTNVSAATMGWSLTTALMQPFGLTQSIVRIGPKWVLKGLGDALSSTAKLQNAMARIGEQSGFMRLRAKTFNREIAEIHGRVKKDRGSTIAGRVIDGLAASRFVLMQKTQLLADVPTWLGAKEKALAQGADEATAIALADQAVIDSQGGGQVKDLAKVQRGGPAMKLLTMFYSYFSTTYNLTAESAAKRRAQARDGEIASAAAGFAADMVLLYAIPALGPALLLSLLSGDDLPEDPEELAKWAAKKQLSFALAPVVLARELGGTVEGFDYAGSPAMRLVSDIGRAGKQTAQGEIDEAMVLAYVRLMGDAFGIPTTQLTRSYRGWTAWADGDAPPTSILFGPPPRN